MTTRPGLTALVDGTPDERVRAVDAYRAFAILVVVVGHWLAIVVTTEQRGGVRRIAGDNILEIWPPSHLITWAVQVLPLIFLAGGFANAASWRAARGRTDFQPWVRGRLLRLLYPTGVFVGVVAAGSALAIALGADGSTVRTAAWLAGIPLWFLAVYLVTVLLTPSVVALVERWRWRGVAGLAGVSAVPAVLHVHAAVPTVGQTTYLLVWGTTYALGACWQVCRSSAECARTGPSLQRVAAALSLVGLGGALLLVALGPYPVSLLIAPDSEVQNSAPPSLALLLYALGQSGIAILVSPAVERWCRRRRVWLAVVAVNAVAMSMYLWHLVPLVTVALIYQQLGLLDGVEPLGGQWFLGRVPWVLACAVVLVPVLAAVRRFERPGVGTPAATGGSPPTHRLTTVVLVCGTVAAVVGIARLTVGGLNNTGPLGLPILELAALLVGIAAVRGSAGTNHRSHEPPDQRRRRL